MKVLKVSSYRANLFIFYIYKQFNKQINDNNNITTSKW